MTNIRCTGWARWAAACVVLLAACREQTPTTTAEEDGATWLDGELGWVEGADPQAMAARDQGQRHVRFMSVCSLECAIVGVSEITVRMCHPNVIVDVVDKTTEAVQSERHTALKSKARAFAEQYNAITLRHLAANGQGECPAPMNWDGAYTEIHGALDKVYSSGFRGDVHVTEQRAFQIRLPRGVGVKEMQGPLCEIIGRHGLKDRASVQVKSVDTADDYARLAC
jgi:hypothetical protein